MYLEMKRLDGQEVINNCHLNVEIHNVKCGEPRNLGCGRNTANGGTLSQKRYDNTVPSLKFRKV